MMKTLLSLRMLLVLILASIVKTRLISQIKGYKSVFLKRLNTIILNYKAIPME